MKPYIPFPEHTKNASEHMLKSKNVHGYSSSQFKEFLSVNLFNYHVFCNNTKPLCKYIIRLTILPSSAKRIIINRLDKTYSNFLLLLSKDIHKWKDQMTRQRRRMS